MERDTHLFAEMTFVITVLGVSYDDYLRNTNPQMRMLNMMWHQLHLAKQSYWNTPEKGRFAFFA